MDELEYLRKVCETQDKFIKGSIGKKELEQELEILRLKRIDYLERKKRSLEASNAIEMQTQSLASEMADKLRQCTPNMMIDWTRIFW